jgi:hypothetical protein
MLPIDYPGAVARMLVLSELRGYWWLPALEAQDGHIGQAQFLKLMVKQLPKRMLFASCTTFRQLLSARPMLDSASAAVLCGEMSLVAETHSVEARGLSWPWLTRACFGGWLFHKVNR